MAKHGAPDWSKYRPDSVTFPVEDLAELAVRLGSIVSFDRRGDVFWMDDFENGLSGWRKLTSGAGAAVATSSTKARNGGYSTKLTSGVTASRYAGISHYLPFPHLSKWGFECHAAINASIEELRLSVRLNDGTTWHDFWVKYDHLNTRLQYFAPGSAWTTFATNVDLLHSDDLFLALKLVVNLNAKSYARLITNETTYDMSSLLPSTYNETLTAHLNYQIRATGNTDDNAVTYIDDVIITQDEP